MTITRTFHIYDIEDPNKKFRKLRVSIHKDERGVRISSITEKGFEKSSIEFSNAMGRAIIKILEEEIIAPNPSERD